MNMAALQSQGGPCEAVLILPRIAVQNMLCRIRVKLKNITAKTLGKHHTARNVFVNTATGRQCA